MKGRTKYYFRNHKIQCIGNIKPEKHDKSKDKKVEVINTIVYNSSIKKTNNKEYWEQESFPITIDSCCSVSIARIKPDFVGTLQKFNVTIQGFNGSTKIKQKVIWRFKIQDNHGTMHDILIPNNLLAPEAQYHLLYPQHWEQSKDPEGKYYMIKHTKC